MQYISDEIDLPLISADLVDLRRDIEVIMNGKDIWFCAHRLKTPLTDGDSAEIWFPLEADSEFRVNLAPSLLRLQAELSSASKEVEQTIQP